MVEPAEDLIVLKDVYKAFGRLKVLNGVSLSIRRGETICIIGQSGVGKSVSLRLMVGLLYPDSGCCEFMGENIGCMGEMDLVELRKNFAMLFQSGALFDSMTIGENIAFPARLRGEKDPGRLQEIVDEKLYQVGLGKSRFPDMPDKMPSMVSGGQRKRIALARALAEEPSIMLYDEPTTGLDPIMSDAIAELILRTRENLKHKNLTSIIVTHDMNVAFKTADRIIMLHGGQVVGEGAPAFFQNLQLTEDVDELEEWELRIRQFVRGEASGPIQAVQ